MKTTDATWAFPMTGPRMVSVLPGDVSGCGVAQFEQPTQHHEWECTRAYQVEPDRAVDLVASWMQFQELDVLVLARPRVFKHINLGEYGPIQAASVFGALRYVHRLNNIAHSADRIHPQTGKRYQPVEFGLVLSGAQVKGKLAAAGIRSTAVATSGGDLARDAELNGWAWIFARNAQGVV